MKTLLTRFLNLFTFIIILMNIYPNAQAKIYDFTEGNNIELVEDPYFSADLKVDLIRKAKHHIHIITFFWDESELPKRLADELKKANDRGVEVRILTTGVPTFTTDIIGRGRRYLKDHKGNATFAFVQLVPGRYFSITHSLHEKIFIADGEVAIIGGRNISNSSFKGKDLEVKMQGPVVNQAQDHFKRMFDFVVSINKKTKCVNEENQKCEEKMDSMLFEENKAYFPSQNLHSDGVKARFLSHEALIHHYESKMNKRERLLQRDDILETVMNIDFEHLRAYQYFMMPTARFSSYLHSNLEQGKKIEIITNSLESGKFSSNSGYIYSLPETLEFVKKGMEVYQWEKEQKLNYVHEKVLIFDDRIVMIGSHNLVTGSTGVSNEVAVEIHSTNLANRLISVFDKEKTDEAITQNADVSLFLREIDEYKIKIKLLRSKLIGGFLREIY